MRNQKHVNITTTITPVIISTCVYFYTYNLTIQIIIVSTFMHILNIDIHSAHTSSVSPNGGKLPRGSRTP